SDDDSFGVGADAEGDEARRPGLNRLAQGNPPGWRRRLANRVDVMDVEELVTGASIAADPSSNEAVTLTCPEGVVPGQNSGIEPERQILGAAGYFRRRARVDPSDADFAARGVTDRLEPRARPAAFLQRAGSPIPGFLYLAGRQRLSGG